MTTMNTRILPQGNIDFADRRLTEMSGNHFVSMDCEGALHNVGDVRESWTPSELDGIKARIGPLASDPAKGDHITDGSLEEAAVALTAEKLDVFHHLTRETSGSAEFVDEHGASWDVKSPLSPPPNQNWAYSPEHQIVKLRHDFSQGDKVLFNLTRLNDKDEATTISLLRHELNCQERGQVLILTDFNG